MTRAIQLTLENCGETTCAREYGVMCEHIRARMDGYEPRCRIFQCRLFDKNGDIMGWLLRCPECLLAEVEVAGG